MLKLSQETRPGGDLRNLEIRFRKKSPRQHIHFSILDPVSFSLPRFHIQRVLFRGLSGIVCVTYLR